MNEKRFLQSVISTGQWLQPVTELLLCHEMVFDSECIGLSMLDISRSNWGKPLVKMEVVLSGGSFPCSMFSLVWALESLPQGRPQHWQRAETSTFGNPRAPSHEPKKTHPKFNHEKETQDIVCRVCLDKGHQAYTPGVSLKGSVHLWEPDDQVGHVFWSGTAWTSNVGSLREFTIHRVQHLGAVHYPHGTSECGATWLYELLQHKLHLDFINSWLYICQSDAPFSPSSMMESKKAESVIIISLKRDCGHALSYFCGKT